MLRRGHRIGHLPFGFIFYINMKCSKTVYFKMQGRKEEAKVKEGKGRIGAGKREVHTKRGNRERQ